MLDTDHMSVAAELAALFERDLTRLIQQLSAFTDPPALWQCAPGIANSAGNLVLHLEGNLREFVGRILGGVPYRRVRDEEFSSTGIPAAELVERIEEVKSFVPRVIRQLSDPQMQAAVPGDPLGTRMSTQQFLIHLHGHLNYHLGQIDYLRRILTGGSAVEYVR